MNHGRQQELERGLNGVAKKVLALVPIQEPWEPSRIHREALREGHHIERRVVDGCLSALVSSGLVREPSPGVFIRIRPKPIAVPEFKETTTPMGVLTAPATVTQHEPRKEGTLDKLAQLAGDLRKLSNEAAHLASRVEDAAVEVEEERLRLREEAGKMRELKALLKSLD
jgi:hypothetical protein